MRDKEMKKQGGDFGQRPEVEIPQIHKLEKLLAKPEISEARQIIKGVLERTAQKFSEVLGPEIRDMLKADLPGVDTGEVRVSTSHRFPANLVIEEFGFSHSLYSKCRQVTVDLQTAEPEKFYFKYHYSKEEMEGRVEGWGEMEEQGFSDEILSVSGKVNPNGTKETKVISQLPHFLARPKLLSEEFEPLTTRVQEEVKKRGYLECPKGLRRSMRAIAECEETDLGIINRFGVIREISVPIKNVDRERSELTLTRERNSNIIIIEDNRRESVKL